MLLEEKSPPSPITSPPRSPPTSPSPSPLSQSGKPSTISKLSRSHERGDDNDKRPSVGLKYRTAQRPRSTSSSLTDPLNLVIRSITDRPNERHSPRNSPPDTTGPRSEAHSTHRLKPYSRPTKSESSHRSPRTEPRSTRIERDASFSANFKSDRFPGAHQSTKGRRCRPIMSPRTQALEVEDEEINETLSSVHLSPTLSSTSDYSPIVLSPPEKSEKSNTSNNIDPPKIPANKLEFDFHARRARLAFTSPGVKKGETIYSATPIYTTLNTALLSTHCGGCLLDAGGISEISGKSVRMCETSMIKCGRCKAVQFCSLKCYVHNAFLHHDECRALARRNGAITSTSVRLIAKFVWNRKRNIRCLFIQVGFKMGAHHKSSFRPSVLHVAQRPKEEKKTKALAHQVQDFLTGGGRLNFPQYGLNSFTELVSLVQNCGRAKSAEAAEEGGEIGRMV
ncbi:hypothetical protein IAR55_001937 [Kwoniella newhampshirensis]|uniref:MYND-type domain-containing protein n=1 Tax=Kwoniella newhampshirensis TaxID=1651941 RepID=A0AAW0Z3L5_9TREE